MGSATAYWLARLLDRRLTNVIIERDISYGHGATGRSAGGVRQQFSTPENIALSQATVGLLRNLKAEFGAEADVSFREQGYLLLASDAGRRVLADNHAVQRQAGADTVLLDRDALKARFPWLHTAGLAAGCFGRSGEGWIDPSALMTLMRKSAVAAGTEIVTGDVVGIQRSGGVITHIDLASSERIACGALVNAAGPWAGRLSALAGADLPVEPRKRYVYVIDSRRAGEDIRRGPLTVDPSGVWFRPEGRTFLCGVSPDEATEPPAADLEHIDYAPFEDIVWPVLAARVPAFEESKLLNAWAGFYDYNTLDQNAIVGPHPDIRNFHFINGFSGHGLQQAYGAGRALAELIVFGAFRTIDLSRFGYARVASRTPLRETNVI
jgi:glycine/D-amino acid oxidase-like deaminating enzyme